MKLRVTNPKTGKTATIKRKPTPKYPSGKPKIQRVRGGKYA